MDLALWTAKAACESPMRPREAALPVEWRVLPGLSPYEYAVAAMEMRVDAIAEGRASEAVWLLEHPPLYTAGTSAKEADLFDARFPIHRAGRGGQFTYHGPGQRIAYAMLDLTRRQRDVRAFVCALEDWLIRSLADLGVAGERREGRVGVWVARPDKPAGAQGEPADLVLAIWSGKEQGGSFTAEDENYFFPLRRIG